SEARRGALSGTDKRQESAMTLQSLIHMLIQRQGRSAARLLPLAGLAFGAPVAAQHDASVEQMIVLGERVYPVVDTIAPSTEHAIDTAELRRELPGANLNANGVLSGIAQYRGLYGDRVTVTLDG